VTGLLGQSPAAFQQQLRDLHQQRMQAAYAFRAAATAEHDSRRQAVADLQQMRQQLVAAQQQESEALQALRAAQQQQEELLRSG
jgi:hypothetical protein